MRTKGFLGVLILWGAALQAGPAGAAQAFTAPAQPSGTVDVKLYPMPNVAPGTPKLVTFGVPFTRGSVTPAGVAQIRVLRGGAEIPAFVEMLTPWRHLTDAAQDGTSVRVARVQITHAFTAAFPGSETITVEWGLNNRARNVATFQDPRTAWHTVDGGSFAAADGVQEPDVYAVLPADILSRGALKLTRMQPFAAAVPEAPEDWSVMAGATFPGFEELEHAHKNFFYTMINDPHPFVAAANAIPYKDPANTEPWLYDRASTMYLLYFRSGFLKALREAVQNAEYYRMGLLPSGLFKNGDPKYTYNECLAYTLWLTGDELHRQDVPRVAQAQENNVTSRWTPTLGFWTERHAAFQLLANAVAFEVTGAANWRANAVREADNLIWHQDGAGGQLPAGRVDGGLYHFGGQHGDGEAAVLVASHWMSALLMDAMLRVYALREDAATGHFLRRMGAWAKEVLKFDTDIGWSGLPSPWYYPCYMVRFDGDPDAASGGDFVEAEHAPDVAVMIAWGAYFTDLLGHPADPSLAQRSRDLYRTHSAGIKSWTRSGVPHYRVTPPRKWGWQYRVTGSLSWILEGSGPADRTPPARPKGLKVR